MPLQLETERLILKEFSEADASNLLELNSDPDVVKYTGEEPFKSLEAALNFIKNYNQYSRYKMGRLNIFLKSTGEYLGWCGLKYLEDKDEVDLGYRLHKRYWGKGYATEASTACLNYGFNTLHLNKIIASAMKPNFASISIMKKLGMKYSHDEDCGCNPGVVYVITKDEWK